LSLFLNIEAFYHGLIKCGYDVDWRIVRVGEDLSKYDRVITVIQDPRSMSSRYLFGVIWAFYSNPNSLLYFGDWQIFKTAYGIEYVGKAIDKKLWGVFNSKTKQDYKVCIEDPGLKKLIEGFFVNFKGKFENKLILPLYPKGDIKKVSKLAVKDDLIKRFDPTPLIGRYVPDGKVIRAREKKKAWVLGALSNVQGKRLFTSDAWPVYKFGNINNKEKRLTQEDLFQMNKACWGNVIFPHDHAGSGWFRYGYMMSIDSGSITYCIEEDAKVYGSVAEYVNKYPRQVEKMGDEDLRHLAKKHREEYLDNANTLPKTLNEIKEFIENE